MGLHCGSASNDACSVGIWQSKVVSRKKVVAGDASVSYSYHCHDEKSVHVYPFARRRSLLHREERTGTVFPICMEVLPSPWSKVKVSLNNQPSYGPRWSTRL